LVAHRARHGIFRKVEENEEILLYMLLNVHWDPLDFEVPAITGKARAS